MIQNALQITKLRRCERLLLATISELYFWDYRQITGAGSGSRCCEKKSCELTPTTSQAHPVHHTGMTQTPSWVKRLLHSLTSPYTDHEWRAYFRGRRWEGFLWRLKDSISKRVQHIHKVVFSELSLGFQKATAVDILKVHLAPEESPGTT